MQSKQEIRFCVGNSVESLISTLLFCLIHSNLYFYCSGWGPVAISAQLIWVEMLLNFKINHLTTNPTQLSVTNRRTTPSDCVSAGGDEIVWLKTPFSISMKTKRISPDVTIFIVLLSARISGGFSSIVHHGGLLHWLQYFCSVFWHTQTNA